MPKRIAQHRDLGRHFIREWRKGAHLSRDDLAERLGMSANTLWRIETGVQPYTQRVLEGVAAALEVGLIDLLAHDPTGGAPSPWDISREVAKIDPYRQAMARALVKNLVEMGPPPSSAGTAPSAVSEIPTAKPRRERRKPAKERSAASSK